MHKDARNITRRLVKDSYRHATDCLSGHLLFTGFSQGRHNEIATAPLFRHHSCATRSALPKRNVPDGPGDHFLVSIARKLSCSSDRGHTCCRRKALGVSWVEELEPMDCTRPIYYPSVQPRVFDQVSRLRHLREMYWWSVMIPDKAFQETVDLRLEHFV